MSISLSELIELKDRLEEVIALMHEYEECEIFLADKKDFLHGDYFYLKDKGYFTYGMALDQVYKLGRED